MASAEEPGEVQILFTDKNNGNGRAVLTRDTTAGLSQAVKAPSGVTYDALPKMPFSAIRCFGRIWLKFTPIGTDIIESEESAAEIPMKFYSATTGKLLYQKTLTMDNMTGFTSAGNVDITCTGGVPYDVCYFDVPAGTFAMVDSSQKVHVYIGDDT